MQAQLSALLLPLFVLLPSQSPQAQDTIYRGSPELRELAYFEGAWDVASVSGKFRLRVEPAMEERILQSTFGSINAQGRFDPTGVTVRTYDEANEVYRNLWYDQTLNFITEFEGHIQNRQFLFAGKGHNGPRPHLERARLLKKGQAAYTWNMDKSFDGGQTWRKGHWYNTTTRAEKAVYKSTEFDSKAMSRIDFLLGEFHWKAGAKEALQMPGRAEPSANTKAPGYLASRLAMGGKVIETTWGRIHAEGERIPAGLSIWGFDRGSNQYRMLSYDRSLNSLMEYAGNFEDDTLLLLGRGHTGNQIHQEKLSLEGAGERGFYWRCERTYRGFPRWLAPRQEHAPGEARRKLESGLFPGSLRRKR